MTRQELSLVAENLFDIIDKNCNGVIERDELLEFFKVMAEAKQETFDQKEFEKNWK